MRRTQAKHAKATPRGRVPRPTRRGRGGLLLGALAVLVAAIVAIPALSALAASPVTVEISRAEDANPVSFESAAVYSSAATYDVTVTVPEGCRIDESAIAVSGSEEGSVDWSDPDGSWAEDTPADEGEPTPTVYSRSVTVNSGSWNQITVTVPYTDGSSTSQTATRTSEPITIDRAAPEVAIEMSNTRIGHDEGIDVDFYGDENLTATVTVRDSSFDKEETTVNGEKAEWTGSKGTYMTEVDCSKINNIEVVAKELADTTRSTSKSYGEGIENLGSSFKIDTKKPEITFELKDARGNELTGSAFNQNVTVEVTVSMDRWGTVETPGDGGWTDVKKNDTTHVYTKTYTVDKDEGKHEIVFSATKKGFFQKESSNPLNLTIDKTAPTASVSYNLTPVKGTNYYNTSSEDLKATISVTEALSFDSKLITVTTNEGEAANVSWNGTTGTVTFPKDGSFSLSISGKDAAGNELTIASDSPENVSSQVITDSKVPAIDVTYVNKDDVEVTPNAKGYFNTEVTPTVAITEANFSENNTLVTVTKGTEKVSIDSTWVSKDDSHMLALPKLEDGMYTVTVNTKDYAGHEATYTKTFTIDTTPITFGHNWAGPEQGDVVTDDSGTVTYYPGTRTLTLTPSETNFTVGKDGLVIDTGSQDVTPDWDAEKGCWTVTFDKDGIYHLTATGVDDAGNSVKDWDSGTFVIDTTAPVLDVTFADGDAATDTDDATGTSYYAAKRIATITVTEANFNPDRVEIDTKGTYDKSAWLDAGNGVHTLEVTFPESADRYEMTVSATDRAGNEAVKAAGETAPYTYDSGTFVVDLTAPTVSIALNQELVQTFNGADYFSAAPTATVTVKDVNFKEADSSITVTGGTVGTWTKGDTDENGVTTWTAPVTFTEGAGRTLSVTAADWANHDATGAYGTATTDSAGTPLASGTFTVDLTAPEVTSASVDQDPSNNYGDNYYFNAATTLTVNVEDAIGLESLSVVDADEDDQYYVLDNQIEAGATSGTVTIGFADGHDFDRAVTVRTTDLASNYRYWSIAPDGTVQAVNYADPSNEPVFDGTYPETMLQDTVDPVVTLSGAQAGTYYNSPQSILLSVEELNVPILKTFEPDQVVLTVTQVAGDASGATRSWTRPLSQLASTGEGIGYALTEPLSADGHYTVTAQVTDPATNQGTAKIGEFTIDQTAPVVEVAFDNNDVRNGKYYNAGRTATITVTEHNFDPSLVSVETNGAVGSWSTNGDVHTLTVSFSADGVYNLAVSGADQAGNAMTPYQADEFVVDTQAPEITFGGVEDATAYNGDVEPTITYADEANFDPNGITYTVTGTKNGTVDYQAFTSSEAQGATVSYANFVREPDVDDIYTINAHMADLAGNEAEGSVTFSVNRFGSTFRVVDAGSYTENDGYLTERRDVVVEEINVSGVASENHGVTVTEGTNVDELTLNDEAQDTGYTIESGTSHAEDSNGWSVYTYRIAAGNFDRDGRYHVSVQSNDLATNTNTSSNYYDREAGETAAAEVDFILDTTDPVISNLNISDGATYDADTYEGSFTVVENIGVRDVEVLVDGKAVKATDDGFGTYTFEVSSAAFTPRSLEITATDLAGRTGTAAADGFHVTTDIFELHLPWVIAGVVVVLAVAGGAYYLLVVKPKRGDEDEKNDAAA